MVTVSASKQTLKQSKIRYTEYYDLQKVLDDLYEDSSKNKVFSNLMELITSLSQYQREQRQSYSRSRWQNNKTSIRAK